MYRTPATDVAGSLPDCGRIIASLRRAVKASSQRYEFTLEEVDLGNLWADRYQKCLPRMAVFCKLPV